MTTPRLVRNIFLFVGLVIALGIIYLVFLFGCKSSWCFMFEWQKVRATNSFAECAARGFPVTENSPRQCRAGGKIFTDIQPRI